MEWDKEEVYATWAIIKKVHTRSDVVTRRVVDSSTLAFLALLSSAVHHLGRSYDMRALAEGIYASLCRRHDQYASYHSWY
jgi:hypothetical protein